MTDGKQQDTAPIDDIKLEAAPIIQDDIQQDIAQVEGVTLASHEGTTLSDVLRDWWRRVQVPRQSLGKALEGRWFRAAFSLGLALFCAGLALGGGPWWVVALWAGLGLLFLLQGVAVLVAGRRLARSEQVTAPGETGDRNSRTG